jgi:RNase H-like domain found in reverse transcriptase
MSRRVRNIPGREQGVHVTMLFKPRDFFWHIEARVGGLGCKRKLRFQLEIDASDRVVSGIFSQKQKDNTWKLIAYYTKIITLAEYNYPIYNKELLVIIRVFES